jgi:hypothetical protein
VADIAKITITMEIDTGAARTWVVTGNEQYPLEVDLSVSREPERDYEREWAEASPWQIMGPGPTSVVSVRAEGLTEASWTEPERKEEQG